jgi:hypothetical protein
MDAKSSAGVPLSSPAAAQRCAEGAGLDSGAPAAAQSAMPSIAAPCHRTDRRSLSTNAAAPAAPQLQPRISTSLTDVTETTAGPRAVVNVNCLNDRARFTSVPAVYDFEGETSETRSSRHAANWMSAIIRR